MDPVAGKENAVSAYSIIWQTGNCLHAVFLKMQKQVMTDHLKTLQERGNFESLNKSSNIRHRQHTDRLLGTQKKLYSPCSKSDDQQRS